MRASESFYIVVLGFKLRTVVPHRISLLILKLSPASRQQICEQTCTEPEESGNLEVMLF